MKLLLAILAMSPAVEFTQRYGHSGTLEMNNAKIPSYRVDLKDISIRIAGETLGISHNMRHKTIMTIIETPERTYIDHNSDTKFNEKDIIIYKESKRGLIATYPKAVPAGQRQFDEIYKKIYEKINYVPPVMP